MTERTYSTVENGQRLVWIVKRLWEHSRDLPRFEYAIADFRGFDEDCWYGTVNVPTIRSVLEHVKRIEAADLSQPIVLSATGQVMDGIHRICKAWLQGRTTVPAVQFAVDPPPDLSEPVHDPGTVPHDEPVEASSG